MNWTQRFPEPPLPSQLVLQRTALGAFDIFIPAGQSQSLATLLDRTSSVKWDRLEHARMQCAVHELCAMAILEALGAPMDREILAQQSEGPLHQLASMIDLHPQDMAGVVDAMAQEVRLAVKYHHAQRDGSFSLE